MEAWLLIVVCFPTKISVADYSLSTASTVLRLSAFAAFITATILSALACLSALITTVGSASCERDTMPLIALCKESCDVECVPTKNLCCGSMDTTTVCLALVSLSAFGIESLTTLGLARVEIIRKNSSKTNSMSFSADVCVSGLSRKCFLKFIGLSALVLVVYPGIPPRQFPSYLHSY